MVLHNDNFIFYELFDCKCVAVYETAPQVNLSSTNTALKTLKHILENATRNLTFKMFVKFLLFHSIWRYEVSIFCIHRSWMLAQKKDRFATQGLQLSWKTRKGKIDNYKYTIGK